MCHDCWLLTSMRPNMAIGCLAGRDIVRHPCCRPRRVAKTCVFMHRKHHGHTHAPEQHLWWHVKMNRAVVAVNMKRTVVSLPQSVGEAHA